MAHPSLLSLVLAGIVAGCSSSTPEPVEPAGPGVVGTPATPTTGTAEVRSSDPDPCAHLDPHVFDIDDISARTDLTEAQKDELRHAQSERRRTLAECFVRAMDEEKAHATPAKPGP